MSEIRLMSGEQIPLELHKVRIVQKINIRPVEDRRRCIQEAGNNTFLLKNDDVFLDMLTDSGVNAMSDRQLGAMMICDDSYAGSASFFRLRDKVEEIFGFSELLPAHQGRAAENILATRFVKPGSTAIMNYHFTTTKAHITRLGGKVVEVASDEAVKVNSDYPFKGNFDIDKLLSAIKEAGPENVSFIRLEAGTNLIGGQPFSLENARKVCAVAKQFGIPTILDASLLMDNLYFMKTREEQCKNMSIRQITRALADEMDIIYFSARKLGFAKGGGIMVRDAKLRDELQELVTLYEGFLTYGGMSVREIEAITVGLEETMDETVISQGPQFIEFMCRELQKNGVPVVTPPGGLGCHLDAMAFLPHVPQSQYPAGALAAAAYIAGGIRGMERGTVSEQREPDGSEHFSNVELLRLAVPRRVYTLSQIKYAVDRISWLYTHRDLIGGLKFVSEPANLRFFFGRLAAVGDWQEKLVKAFRDDFGDSL